MSYSTDPRALRSREAILGAARALLVDEGPGAITHQRVAESAGVGRATVYRHWPRAEQLMLDVMDGADLPYFRDPPAPLRPWLFAQLRAMADEMAQPAVAAFTLTLMQSSIWDGEMGRRRDESNRTIADRLGAAVAGAVARGELTTDAEPLDVAATLIGPLVYRTAMQNLAVPDALIDRALDAVGTWRAWNDRQ
ncbi:TetR/AcrR family transcriptional regulator [Dactylosporangium sp. NPDC051541]|uniref:TetR/AcrR family transcriptional regulator n=1 Tax=Dactylosporangium sp. NPDC051541 TaxID=3363977 RepID=UPI00378AD11B